MKAYIAKWEYLIAHYGPECPIARENGSMLGCLNLHHLYHNTRRHREKCPLFIDSLLNLRPVSWLYHMQHGSWGRIGDRRAEQYERFLERHPKIARWVNDPEGSLWAQKNQWISK